MNEQDKRTVSSGAAAQENPVDIWSTVDVQPSSPEHPGQLIVHRDFFPDGTPGPLDIQRADRWIQVARSFLRCAAHDVGVQQDGQTLELTIGPPAAPLRYRYVRQFDEHSDLYRRVTVLPGDRPVQPVHGGLCTMDGDWCRSRHCRECGGVADAQGFCPSCPRESGPHADGFLLARRVPNVNDVRKMAEDVLQAQRPGRLSAREEELQKTLEQVLGHFNQQGHPGEPCLRTGWIGIKEVERWRRIAAGRPPWDQLFALIDVKLTPWQQDVLAEAWSYRETHGMWPQVVTSGRQRPGHKTLQAAAAELLERARAVGWAE